MTEKTKNVMLWSALVVSVICLIWLMAKPTTTVIERITQGEPVLGASAISPFNYSVIGDVETVYSKRTLSTSSSTPCNFKSPAATSSLVLFTMEGDMATTSTVLIDIATSTNSTATSSKWTSYTVKAGKKFALATTTHSTIDPGDGFAIFPPNTWLVAKASSDSTNATSKLTFSPVGSCSVEWRRVGY